jgi:membrane complex biogenesis BtpA family protein
MIPFRLVGVLHLPPLPGAANYDGSSIRAMADAAAEDVRILEAAGFSDVMVQDAGDRPQPTTVGAPTVAALSVIGAAVRAATNLKLGVIVGHNHGAASVAVAHAIDADFVRVKVLTGVSVGPVGFIEGCCVEVAQMKRLLGSEVEVWADAHEATSLELVGDMRTAAHQALVFGAADKLIVTRDSGVDDALSDLAQVKEAVGSGVEVLIGGRVSHDTLSDVMKGADGAILGSVLKRRSGLRHRVDAVVAHDLGAQYVSFLSAHQSLA